MPTLTLHVVVCAKDGTVEFMREQLAMPILPIGALIRAGPVFEVFTIKQYEWSVNVGQTICYLEPVRAYHLTAEGATQIMIKEGWDKL
jgi:hypothetical protein